MNKTYLLTGGTGFLGSLLSIELIKRRDKVIFLGRGKKRRNFRYNKQHDEKLLREITDKIMPKIADLAEKEYPHAEIKIEEMK